MLYIEYINAFVCKFKKTSMPEKSFEKILAGRIKTKKWKKKNRDLWLQSKRRYYKKKMLDPKFVLATRLRSRVRKLFKKKKIVKSKSTIALLGTSVEEAVWFLNAFSEYTLHTPGIEVDHVKPVSSYDLHDPIQQIECFSYANMQLLPAVENSAKCDKFSWENYVSTMHADLAYDLRYKHYYWNL